MHGDAESGGGLRLAELIAALSLATDLGLGQPMEYLLRTCLLAVRLGQSMGVSNEVLHDVYFVALLRWIGCTGHAHEIARLFPDEMAARARFALIDMASPVDVVLQVVRHGGEGQSLPARLGTLASAMLTNPRRETEFQFRASCEVAQLLAERLGFGDGVKGALWHAFERWDGRGFPNGVKGELLPVPIRIVLIAQDVEVFCRSGGQEAATRVVRKRSGAAYDPAIAEIFCKESAALLDGLDEGSAWQRVLDAEPLPHQMVAGADFDAALEVVADYADLKSPYTGGHSRGVAELSAKAARGLRLPEADVTSLRRAGLVHDLGRTGVPNGIWDKPGKLSDAEWERVRLHPYLTGRLLARPVRLAQLADVAASHHEGIDGSGYHRAVNGTMLSVPARILAAADSYHAMIEPRSYRAAHPPDSAAEQLQSMVQAGRLDGDAASAVLVAAGHRVGRRREWPAGLTSREVEVLRLVARGLPNRETARLLSISAKTAAHHIQHIYSKIGVSTRGAAALFAMQHGLLADSRLDDA